MKNAEIIYSNKELFEKRRLEIEKKKRSSKLIGDEIEACKPYLRNYNK